MSLVLAIVISAWTNLAGNVISAVPLRVEKNVVVMETKDAVTNRYPLAAFPSDEQRRMRLKTGDYELPRKVADVQAVFVAGLARAEARAKAGRMTPEALQAKRARTAAAWAHELEKREHGLTKEEIEEWKERGMR